MIKRNSIPLYRFLGLAWLKDNFYKFRPSLLSLYIIREQLPPMAAGVFFFTFIFIVNKIIILLSLLIEKDVPAKYSLELFLLMLPFSMALTVPIAILMATIMAMGRLSSDSEVVAMRASGFSYYRIYQSLIFMGMVYTVLMILFNNYLLPYANLRYRVLYDEIEKSTPVTLLDEKVFNHIPGTKQTIYVDEIDKKNKQYKNVIIYQENKNNSSDIIIARLAEWLHTKENDSYRTMRLYQGYLHLASEQNKQYTLVDFSDRYMDINVRERGVDFSGNKGMKSEREKTFAESYRDLKQFMKLQAPNLGQQNIRQEIAYRKLEFWKHFSLPFACLALTLIGAPLGIVSHRSGRGMGFGFAVVVSFVYYLILMMGERLTKELVFSAWFGAWAPVLVVAIVGVMLIYFRNSAENVVQALDELLQKLFGRRKKS